MSPIPQSTWDALGVSRESVARLEVLARVLREWQPRINLIANSTLDGLWERHIVDSAQLLPLFPKGVAAVADLGSGGGFPALVLAAIQPAPVHMFEANAKKAAFLQEALRQMKVTGLVHRQRLVERLSPRNMPQVQVVTARAFAPLEQLLGYAEPFLKQGAMGLFHKGQDVDAELTAAAKSWTITVSKHLSRTDPRAVILEVKELTHADGR